MKKLAFLFVLSSALFATDGWSQGMGFAQRMTAEERVKRITDKLDSAFKLDPARFSLIDTALKVLYRKQDARRDEIMSSGTMPDRETMMAEMKKYGDVQDEILSSVLSKEEFAIWKEKIQPTMRPRGMGGPGGPGGGGGQRRERNDQ